MPDLDLSEEDVMSNDVDPLEGIREIRREEGVPEDELIVDNHADLDPDPVETETEEEADAEELQEAKGETAEEEVTDAEKDPVEDATDTGDEGDSDKPTADQDDSEEEASAEETPSGLKFKANGQEFEFTQEEVLAQFETVFGKAANYTQKMQKIAPYRKMISALEQEGVTHDSLNLALDALKGDKGAIKKLLENNKLDAYDLTSDEEKDVPYTPNVYGKDETLLEIEEITSRIQSDEEFAITKNVIDEQWDAASRQAIASNPNYITGLHNDIKAGIFDQVSPAAMKMKVLDGSAKSDIEYYMIAGEQFRVAMEAQTKQKEGQKQVDELNADAQSADSKFDEASSQANRKRSASSTGARADRKGVIDYLDDDDEAFDEWYKNLESKT